MAYISPKGFAQRGERIDSLDGWRTVSVALVIFSHVLMQSSVNISDRANTALGKIFVPLIQALGYVGVDIFFVISGFVICRGFLKEVGALGRISLRAFYVRRLFRIVPPLMFYVFAIYVLALFHVVDESSYSIVRALTFTCDFPESACGGRLGGHTWSLSAEEQFYLVIPVLFAVFAVYRGAALTAIACLLPLIVLLLNYQGETIAAGFLRNFSAIGFGVACALNEGPLRKVVSAAPEWLFYVALVAILVLARLLNTRDWPVADLGLAVVITYVLLASMNKGSCANRCLGAAPMRAIGKASYGLYLWQQLATNPFPGAGIGFYCVSLALCLLLVLAVFHWLEKPLIKLGASISTRLQTAGASSTATNVA
jgi:peptidoglycan/LPS O-acetylase OafA/YrhL